MSASSHTVSIVMPLWNKAQYVEWAVNSVLAQDYQDFELLVIDDESTDGGDERVRTRFTDDRVLVIRQPHAGVGTARNCGLRLAKGNLIAFLDADDEWYPTHLSDLVSIAREFPSAGLVTTRLAVRRPDDRISHTEEIAASPSLIENYFAIAIEEPLFVHSSSCAVRREVVTKVGGFLEATPYGEDKEYWARISLYFHTAFHPRVSAIYREGLPNSAMSKWKWKAALPPVVETLRDYLTHHPREPKASEVLDYVGWILTSHAAEGIKSGACKEASGILADPILPQCQFQRRRVQLLSMVVVMPGVCARVLSRVHALPVANFWRKLYAKLILPKHRHRSEFKHLSGSVDPSRRTKDEGTANQLVL